MVLVVGITDEARVVDRVVVRAVVLVVDIGFGWIVVRAVALFVVLYVMGVSDVGLTLSRDAGWAVALADGLVVVRVVGRVVTRDVGRVVTRVVGWVAVRVVGRVVGRVVNGAADRVVSRVGGRVVALFVGWVVTLDVVRVVDWIVGRVVGRGVGCVVARVDISSAFGVVVDGLVMGQWVVVVIGVDVGRVGCRVVALDVPVGFVIDRIAFVVDD